MHHLLAHCFVQARNGILWPRTRYGEVVRVPCRQAGEMFRLGPEIRRPCLDSGYWGEVDMTSCTVADRVEPFLFMWVLALTEETSISPDTKEQLESEVSLVDFLLSCFILFVKHQCWSWALALGIDSLPYIVAYQTYSTILFCHLGIVFVCSYWNV